MTIRHLNIFVAVADYGSMSAAATHLYLSQPTVSQAIRELEKHYNVLLFERLGNGGNFFCREQENWSASLRKQKN